MRQVAQVMRNQVTHAVLHFPLPLDRQQLAFQEDTVLQFSDLSPHHYIDRPVFVFNGHERHPNRRCGSLSHGDHSGHAHVAFVRACAKRLAINAARALQAGTDLTKRMRPEREPGARVVRESILRLRRGRQEHRLLLRTGVAEQRQLFFNACRGPSCSVAVTSQRPQAARNRPEGVNSKHLWQLC